MKNVKIMDCTLRDGGRIINCQFEDRTIKNIAQDLTDANIDIVEIGFLRSEELVNYHGNSTFFTDTTQMERFLPKDHRNTIYVAFADFQMYDFEKLKPCDGNSITGIRVGFTKKQYLNQLEEIKRVLQIVLEKGYLLFVQAVNILAYSDEELHELLAYVNELNPYSFGIVDTYGGMYLEDLIHYYQVVEANINSDIYIDLHSHNNFQSSFAFAQEVVRMSKGTHPIILDATLNGMGKCAGNLNTELIADYLTRKKNYDYVLDKILDTIDRYLVPLKKDLEWGYSIPAFMAGIYKSHPNNIIYLTEKYRLNSKDIKYIISEISEEKRQRYDYDNIQRIYKEYNERICDDTKQIAFLKQKFRGKHILVVAPGRNAVAFQKDIVEFCRDNNCICISVNFIPEAIASDFYFYANPIHWGKVCNSIDRSKSILVSSLHEQVEGTILVDYSSLIADESILGDNSVIMLLNLLRKLEVSRISLAGFDGLTGNSNNYVSDEFPNTNGRLSVEDTNAEVKRLYWEIKEKCADKVAVETITPSLYTE